MTFSAATRAEWQGFAAPHPSFDLLVKEQTTAEQLLTAVESLKNAASRELLQALVTGMLQTYLNASLNPSATKALQQAITGHT